MAWRRWVSAVTIAPPTEAFQLSSSAWTVSRNASTRSVSNAGAGLGEPLGDHDPEREAGVDDVGSDPLGGGHPALGQGAEPRFACEGHALLDGLERASVEQVGCKYGVSRLPQLIGERPDSLG